MKEAIYGYKSQIDNYKYHEGYVVFRKKKSDSWSKAIENSLTYLAKERNLKSPIITWFYKL